MSELLQMSDLQALASRVAQKLIERKETVAIAESSAGGLISAALLAVPGASAYFLGGAVVYTAAARAALVGIAQAEMKDMRASSEPYALLLAARIRASHGASWGLSETGAAGPAGNRYGDASGHVCFAVSGPKTVARTLETASKDRAANMDAFARAALGLLDEALDHDFFKRRAGNAKPSDLLHFLENAGNEPPQPGDELP